MSETERLRKLTSDKKRLDFFQKVADLKALKLAQKHKRDDDDISVHLQLHAVTSCDHSVDIDELQDVKNEYSNLQQKYNDLQVRHKKLKSEGSFYLRKGIF